VAELAAAAMAAQMVTAEEVAAAVEAKDEAVTRDVPLTPIQHWFFAQEFKRPHHWNQSLLLEVRRPVRRTALAQAFAALVRRHAALRLRFGRDEGGAWRQRLLPLEGASSEQAPVPQVDLSLVGEEARARLLEWCCAQVQRSLDLDAGPLMRLLLFSLGEEGGQRLLAVAHHLVTDGVSWRILLAELRHDYEEAARGNGVTPAPLATSFTDWAARLAAYAASEEIEAQIPYWQAAERAAREFRLPGVSRAGVNTEASTAQVTVRLDAERTRALLQDVPRVYRTQIEDALLAALGRALSRWTGRRRVAIELEGHGREPLKAGEPEVVAGAVGWFTSLYPVALEAEWAASGEALKSVKEQLRAVPGKGVGYGVWRYLRGAAEDRRGGEVSFNYHGQLDTVLGNSSLFAAASERVGEGRGGDELRPYKLGVVGSVRGGELVMAWKYSRKLHREKTIKAVADSFIESLKETIEHCRIVEAGGVTPSDFPLVDLKQQQLDKILSKVGKGRLS
jgi:non-ribosomal peptide synthase protein (TIGR01720 family)